MRPSKTEPDGSGELFWAGLDQVINMKYEPVRLVDEIDWDWIDQEASVFYRENSCLSVLILFMVGLLLLKYISELSDEGLRQRRVYDP